MNAKHLILGFAALGVVAFTYENFFKTRNVPTASGAAIVSISIPEFSPIAQSGEALFEANCASCHGVNAVGKYGFAPPLVHKIYEPSHHGDASFLLAVRNGVRAHHWPFGNMPPIENVTRQDVEHITAYVRELQRANGIF